MAIEKRIFAFKQNSAYWLALFILSLQRIFLAIILAFYLVTFFNYCLAEQIYSPDELKIKIQQAESDSLSDKFISGSLKIMARLTLSIIDFDQVKRRNIERIKHKDEAKFRSELAKLCDEIENSPLEGIFGIRRDLTKKEAMRIIWRLKKDEVSRLIDSIPDYFIAQKIRSYFSEHKITLNKTNIAACLKNYWERFTKKASIEMPEDRNLTHP